jgi:AcrR family transcriptional regulator
MTEESQIARRRRSARVSGSAEYVERRGQIVETAARLFAEKGFHRTSFNDIAEACGFERASLYYYMANKSDIFEAVALEPADQNVREIVRIWKSDAPPDEKLATAIRHLMTSFADQHPSLYVYIRQDARGVGLDQKRSARMRRIWQRHDAAFSAIIQEGLDAGTFRSTLPARVLALSIVGMLAWSNNWFRPEGVLTGQEIGDGLGNMIISGLKDGTGVGPSAGADRTSKRRSPGGRGTRTR